MSSNWRCWIPVLRVRDARDSIDFYCRKLGFTKDWEHQFDAASPLYASVSRNDCTLHLSEHGDEQTRITLVVSVENVDATYQELCTNGLTPDSPPEDRPYGTRDFSLTDPDGHGLVISMPLSHFDNAPGRTSG